jgi:hypothetical protein
MCLRTVGVAAVAGTAAGVLLCSSHEFRDPCVKSMEHNIPTVAPDTFFKYTGNINPELYI